MSSASLMNAADLSSYVVSSTMVGRHVRELSFVTEWKEDERCGILKCLDEIR